MPRTPDWQREALEAIRRELWSLRGPNRVVKVLPSTGDVASSLGGYITVGRFLLGKTPRQIERDLGLRSGSLRDGARIYKFSRLPGVSEYEYDLTADHPGGLVYSPTKQSLQSAKMQAFSQNQKLKTSRTESIKRRRSDSNRCIKVLQTSPLPLGYGAIHIRPLL
jgi:hypothetical protein